MEEDDERDDSKEINLPPPPPEYRDPMRNMQYFSKGEWKRLHKRPRLHSMKPQSRGNSRLSNFFHMQHMTACDTGLEYQVTQQFIANTKCDLLVEKL